MNRFMLRSLALLTVVGAIMTSCGNEDTPKGPDDKNPGGGVPEKVESALLECTPDLDKAVGGQYAVGTGILGKLMKENNGDNVLFSPFSFHLTASMVANGASGETADELLDFLGATDKDFLNNTNRDLISSVPALDREVVFEIANAVWTDTNLPVKEEFTSTLKDNYSSGFHTVKYGVEDVVGVINSWVKEHTHGMIDYLFDPSNPPEGPVTVVNTLYMKAPWNIP